MDKIPHRLDNVNYRGRRIYHITMVTEGRRCILGHVEGNPDIPAGQPGAPCTRSSELGKAVITCLRSIPHFHPEARLIAYQLMPDHLHFILFITADGGDHLGRIIQGFKIGCNKAYRVVGGPAILSQAQKQVGGPAIIAQAQERRRPTTEERKHGLLWQTSYYEKPLSGKDQLERMIAYVHDNPRRLLLKRQHSHLFHPVPLPVSLPSVENPLAVGNLSLLSSPRRIAVRISRRISQAALQEALAHIMEAAHSGAVIISPFISPGEVAVRDALLTANLPYIRIDGEGFSPYYKPPGYEIAAVAATSLLIIAPWPYSPRRIRLTKADFEAMNAIAAQLGTERWNFAPEH